jgi:integrase
MKGTVFFRESKSVTNGGRKKKAGSWTYAFSVTKADGKRRQITKGGFRTKAACEAALAVALADHGASPNTTAVEPSKMSVERYLLDEWLPTLTSTLKPSSVEHYRAIVAAYVIPHIGDSRLCDVTPNQLVKLYTALRTKGRRKPTKTGITGLSERTVRHAHVALSAAFGHAVEMKMLRHSPVAELPRKSRPKQAKHLQPEIHAWTAEEAQMFLEVAAGDRLGAMYDLDLNTGLRRGELVGLRWVDVDLERGRLSIRKNRVTIDYQVEEGTPKGGQARTIDLDGPTIAVLRAHRKRQLEERMAWGEAWTDTELVFTREDGTGLHPQTAMWHFRRLTRATNAAQAKQHTEANLSGPAPTIPTIRLHDLRHTHATLGLAAGVPPKVMQERLGHSSIQITMDLYSHVIPGMQADAASKIGGLLRKKAQ